MMSSRDPPHLKDEVMDVEFTHDDHRKRRRNRTTQSCLNCHTSKRKCDRKRPCQRCIQLGLTGLCVYEVDDPSASSLGEDGDETTRLRGRIAELETLVRELRGKPHPRWAEANVRDADPSEKWHSRATRSEAKQTLPSRELVEEHGNNRGRRAQTLAPPTKQAHHLYRLSPSPPPPVRSSTTSFPSVARPTARFASENYDEPRRTVNSNNYYHSHVLVAHDSQPSSSTSFHHENSIISHSRPYIHQHFSHSDAPQAFCSCRLSPGNSGHYISLLRQLDDTLHHLNQYSPHATDTHCLLYRRISELHNLMQGNDPSDVAGPKYASSHGSDTEILSPTSFQGSPTEWSSLSPVGYNPYFPV